MKNLKTVTGIGLMDVLGFTSCQRELDDLQEINTNTNLTNPATMKI